MEQCEEIEQVVVENGLSIAYLNQPLDASELCKRLVEQDIYPSHLIKRKPSLEDQFLNLTQNN